MQQLTVISIFPQAQRNYFLRLHFLGFSLGISGSILFSGMQAGATQWLGRLRAQLEP